MKQSNEGVWFAIAILTVFTSILLISNFKLVSEIERLDKKVTEAIGYREAIIDLCYRVMLLEPENRERALYDNKMQAMYGFFKRPYNCKI